MTAQPVGLGAYLPAGPRTDTVRHGNSPDRGFRLNLDKVVTTDEAVALAEAFGDTRSKTTPKPAPAVESTKEDGVKGRHLDVRA